MEDEIEKLAQTMREQAAKAIANDLIGVQPMTGAAGQIFSMHKKHVKNRTFGVTSRWVLEDIILDWNMSEQTLDGRSEKMFEWSDYIIIEGNNETKKFRYITERRAERGSYVLYEEMITTTKPWRLYFR